jgi:hypothetical protein
MRPLRKSRVNGIFGFRRNLTPYLPKHSEAKENRMLILLSTGCGLCSNEECGEHQWGANEEQRHSEETIKNWDKHKERRSNRHVTRVEEHSEAKENRMLSLLSTGCGLCSNEECGEHQWGANEEQRDYEETIQKWDKHKERLSNRHVTRMEEHSEDRMLSLLSTGCGLCYNEECAEDQWGAKEEQRHYEETIQKWDKHKERLSNRHVTRMKEHSEAEEKRMASLLSAGCGLCYNEECGEHQWGANEEQRHSEETIEKWDKHKKRRSNRHVTRVKEHSEAKENRMPSLLYTGFGPLHTGFGLCNNEECAEDQWGAKEEQRQDEETQKWDKHKERRSKRHVTMMEEENKALTKSIRAAQKELIEQDNRIVHLATQLQLKKAELDDATTRIKLLQNTLDKAVEALEEAVTLKNQSCMSEVWFCMFE